MKLNKKANELIKYYGLEKHIEGGWYKEINYPATKKDKPRPLFGHCFFLLKDDEIDVLHKLDCDEAWYFHEGSGLIVYSIDEKNKLKKIIFNKDNPYIVFKKGVIFGAENIDKSSYTFFSCLTVPRFSYKGLVNIKRKDIKKKILIDDKYFIK